MRNAVLAVLAAGGLAMVGAVPAEAVGSRYPFCIQGNDNPGLSNCTFTSYEQCQASALTISLLRRESLLQSRWRPARLSRSSCTFRLSLLLRISASPVPTRERELT